jgi:hypothetical protein
MDVAWTENTALHKAYCSSREEMVALKAAVDTLTQRLDQHVAILAPPSLDLMASSTTIEEMMMQLSVLQHDIQDVLEAVRNPPSKRKQHTSGSIATHHMATVTPPLRSQQQVPKPSISPSDWDLQHTFT